jgi:hypothetical protein
MILLINVVKYSRAVRCWFVIPPYSSTKSKTIWQKSLEHFPNVDNLRRLASSVTLDELKMHANESTSPAEAANVHNLTIFNEEGREEKFSGEIN